METARQLETSGALAKFRSDPRPKTPSQRIANWSPSINTTKPPPATNHLRKFPTTPAEKNGAMDEPASPAKANLLRLCAFQLRPDLPEARIGVARTRPRPAPDQACCALLDFMEKPGAAQLTRSRPLNNLPAHRKLRDAICGLELFRHPLAELPALSVESVPQNGFAFRDRRHVHPSLNQIQPSCFFQRPPPAAPGKVANRTAS